MSSSDRTSSESDESGNESLPDLHKLKPYNLEPRISSSDLSSSSNENSSYSYSEPAEESSIGNVDWCLCGKCLPMTSYTENICCLDTNEVPDEYFEGIYPYILLLILHIATVYQHHYFNNKTKSLHSSVCHSLPNTANHKSFKSLIHLVSTRYLWFQSYFLYHVLIFLYRVFILHNIILNFFVFLSISRYYFQVKNVLPIQRVLVWFV